MKETELSVEELELVKKLREDKARVEEQNRALAEEIKKEEERRLANKDIEAKFKQAIIDTESQIAPYLKAADDALEMAIRISEKTGIPFKCDLICMPLGRKYNPDSFDTIWKDKLGTSEDRDEILYDYGFSGYAESGWEYWNSSSLYC